MYEALILLELALNPPIENYAKEVEKFYVSNVGEKPKKKKEMVFQSSSMELSL
jgi:hypothetical protein